MSRCPCVFRESASAKLKGVRETYWKESGWPRDSRTALTNSQGGERQRIAIARALIFNPPLLLADEPTGNLDSATGEEILELLDALHAEYQTTIVLVTHNAMAAEHCDRLLVIKDGAVSKEEVREVLSEV